VSAFALTPAAIISEANVAVAPAAREPMACGILQDDAGWDGSAASPRC
jgi:hypothetical protein